MKWAVCIDNHGYEADLERRKLYPVIDDEKSDTMGCIRVVDESGEDYVYPRRMFIELPVAAAIETQLKALIA
jgi:hypothetical protein